MKPHITNAVMEVNGKKKKIKAEAVLRGNEE